MPGERLIDLGLDPSVVALGGAAHFRAQPVSLVDDRADQLGHALEGRRAVDRKGEQRQEVLQELLFQRQRTLAPDLKIERVELEARRELKRREDRFMPPGRAERLLNETDEAFRRTPDIRLADQRQLGAVAAESGRGQAQPDIDRVGEHALARAWGRHEDVDDERALPPACGVVAPDAAIGPAEQHAALFPWRGGAVPRQECEGVPEKGERGIGGGRQGKAGHAAHGGFERIADHRCGLAVAPCLDALSKGRGIPAQPRVVLDGRPGGEAGAQHDGDMVVVATLAGQHVEGAHEILVAGEHGEKLGRNLLHRHGRRAASFDDERGAPRDAVTPERGEQLDEGPRIFRTNRHVDGCHGVLAELDVMATQRDGVGVEELIGDGRPEQMLAGRRRSFRRHPRHRAVSWQRRAPLAAGGFAIHDLAGDPDRIVRLDLIAGHALRTERVHHARDEGVVACGHDGAAKKGALRRSETAELGGVGGVVGLELPTLLLGQDGGSRPEHQVGGLPAHLRRPNPSALVEDVVELEPDLTGYGAAGIEIDALDLDQGSLRIRHIPADDRVAFVFERARQLEPHAFGDGFEVGALGHPLHAVEPDPGSVMATLADEGAAIDGFEIAECAQRLAQHEREAGEHGRQDRSHLRHSVRDAVVAPVLKDVGVDVLVIDEELACGQDSDTRQEAVAVGVARGREQGERLA